MSADRLFEEGLTAQQNGDFERALELFQATLCANPNHAQAWMMGGLTEARLGRYFNGLIYLQQSLEIDPRQDTWNNVGIICGTLDLLDQAENAFNEALKFGDAFEPFTNLADLNLRRMKLDKTVEYLRKAIKLRPNDPTAHGNLGKVLIAQGRWSEGYRECLWRHKRDTPHLYKKYPPWEGQPLANKGLILYPEGGFGDEILDVRFAKQVAERNPQAMVYLWVRSPLFRLFKHSLQTDNLIVLPQHETPPTKCDYCLGLSDLPLYLNLTAETVPYSEGYLSPPWGPDFDLPRGFKIGLCWLSGKRPLQAWTDRLAKAKSVPLGSLTWLLERKDVTWVSLQFDRANPDVMRRVGMRSYFDDIVDFADTARLINSLDLVISVDTAVAHLAGAMGKPCWNLIRFDEIVTYPPGANMYSSMTFYKQPSPGNWTAVLDRMFKDFDRMMAQQEAAE